MFFTNITETTQYIDRLLWLESIDGLITLIGLAFPAVLALKQGKIIDLVVVIVF